MTDRTPTTPPPDGTPEFQLEVTGPSPEENSKLAVLIAELLERHGLWATCKEHGRLGHGVGNYLYHHCGLADLEPAPMRVVLNVRYDEPESQQPEITYHPEK